MAEEVGDHYLNTSYTSGTTGAFLSGSDIFEILSIETGTAAPLGHKEFGK